MAVFYKYEYRKKMKNIHPCSPVFKANNNGHQNFTLSLGILDPPPFLENIPEKYPFFVASLSDCIRYNKDSDVIMMLKVADLQKEERWM